MSSKVYDFAIIGAGIAGATLARFLSPKLSVVLIEKGEALKGRRDLTSGWFGHNFASMSRLDSPEKPNKFIKKAIDLCRKENRENFLVKRGQQLTKINNVEFLKSKYYRSSPHLSTNLAKTFFQNTNVDSFFETFVERISKNSGRFSIETDEGRFLSKKCIIATGSRSLEWLETQAESLNFKLVEPSCVLGLRVELPARSVKNIVNKTGDLIAILRGEVGLFDFRYNSYIEDWEDYNLITALPLHPLGKKTSKVSFMAGLQHDYKDALRISRIINILSNEKVRKETLQEFELSSVVKYFPEYKKIVEELNKISFIPKIHKTAIIYSPEIQNSGSVFINSKMKTTCAGLYAIGSCTNRVSLTLESMASGIALAHFLRG